MTSNTVDPTQLRVSGADLFLLEKWDAQSPLSDEQQSLEILQAFVRLGFPERWIYNQQVKHRRIRTAADLPEADQALLSRARPFPNERQPMGHIWLRTCYAPGTDEIFATLVETMTLGDPIFFNDAKRYNFGTDWQHIFTLMPTVLRLGRCTPEEYEKRKDEALKECLETEEEEKQLVEDDGDSWSEDGPYWMELYQMYHYACQVGIIFIADEKTLTAQPPEKGQILVAWYDADGNVVRYNRQDGYWAQGLQALYGSTTYLEHAVWAQALPGEKYDWDGPLGPPYELVDKG